MHVIGTQTQIIKANSKWMSSRESLAWIELRQEINKFQSESKTYLLAHESLYTH